MNRREAIERTALILGYAVAAPTIAAIMNGCKATPDLNWKPEFLTLDQARTVSEIAEIIIPKTDTPGAKDVGVPSFIDLILKDVYSEADKKRYMDGLQEFETAAKAESGSAFIDMEPDKQFEFVKKTHDAAVAAVKAPENQGKMERPFILMTKELTMLAFFTSEVGATQVLQYDPVPGAYRGCVPLAEVGKTWAT